MFLLFNHFPEEVFHWLQSLFKGILNLKYLRKQEFLKVKEMEKRSEKISFKISDIAKKIFLINRSTVYLLLR